MSKKSRGRRHSVRDLEPATTSDWREPSVFADMEIEDGRLPDGRRILYYSWHEEEDEENGSWPEEEDEPASEPLAGDAAVVAVAGTIDATGSPDASPEEQSVDDQPADV